MCKLSIRIKSIVQNSPAKKAGLLAGMEIISINGKEMKDGLDYEFYSTASNLEIVVKQEGVEHNITIEKPEYELLGCEFETYLIDKQHTCKNKCIFCFIDQMPKGMRESLYFKDDDERLSFLFGNYVTLTNLSDKEVDRIIEMKISPINISVHTANPALRVKMMKNKYAGEVLKYIPKLAQAGISLNTQLVLCPGVNDGQELRHSIEWLAQFRPNLQSIAAVPVGLTKFRDGLFEMRPYTKEQAKQQLNILLEYGDTFAKEDGFCLVYPSDEWFLVSEMPIPKEEFYDGYLQLENGVGMCRLLEDEFMQTLEELQPNLEFSAYSTDIATGVLAAPLLQKLSSKLMEKFPKLHIKVHTIHNDFFGETITVSGLLTGQDIIHQLKKNTISNKLLLPDVVLRAEGDVLLDDISVETIEKELKTDVSIVGRSGEELLYAMIGEKNKNKLK